LSLYKGRLILPDNLYLRWQVHVARMGARRGIYKVLVVKPEGKRPLGKP